MRRHRPARAESSIAGLEVVPGRTSARRVAAGLIVVGLLLTAVAAWWSMQRNNKDAAEDLAAHGELLVFGTEEILEDADRQLAAAGSLFRASDHVEPAEFAVFVTEMGLMPGILGLGYVPVVPDFEIDEWIAEARDEVPNLALFELDEAQLPAPPKPRDWRFPLLYFEPSELFPEVAGLDLGFHRDWYDDLVGGLYNDGTTMTSFAELGLTASLDDEDQFILGSPIFDSETGEVDALLVAMLDLGMLVGRNVSAEVTNHLSWQVVDATDTPLLLEKDGNVWTDTLSFGGRTWTFRVEASNRDVGLLRDTVVYPVFGGLALTVLLATVGYLAVSRSRGRRRVETLESLNDAKDEFLAAVSHRLRTPLTAVVGFSEVLKDGEIGLSESDRRELLSTIAVQAIELGHLFDNLLTVTRDKNRAMFSPSRVSVAAEVNAVLDTMEPARRAKIRLVTADPEVVVAADPGLIRQILRNLVANATDFGDHVELSVLDEDHIARIVVSDNGCGVPPDREASVFELYDNPISDRGQPKSMGVGLFVSRRLARRMSGDIIYRRESAQTVFELILPALPAPVVTDMSPRTVTVH